MLVGGFSFNHLGKNEFVNGKDYPIMESFNHLEKYESQLGFLFPNIPNILGKKNIFQTTNQLYINAGYMELS